jgi:hypothetical protein
MWHGSSGEIISCLAALGCCAHCGQDFTNKVNAVRVLLFGVSFFFGSQGAE